MTGLMSIKPQNYNYPFMAGYITCPVNGYHPETLLKLGQLEHKNGNGKVYMFSLSQPETPCTTGETT